MSGKRINIYGIKGKYKRKNPRPGSWNLQDDRTGFTINSDDAVKQYNGAWVYPDFYRQKHPHDTWPSIPEEQGVGSSANNSTPIPASSLQCLLRDSSGNVVGVYESTNALTCEIASSAQVAVYQPSIANQTFTLSRLALADSLFVGTIVATDPNGLDLTYRIITDSGYGDANDGTELFTILPGTSDLYLNNSSLITSSLSSFSIIVEARNSQNLSNSATITIAIEEFLPEDFGTLYSYYETITTAGYTIDGSNRVEELTDLSGNGNHLVQTTDDNKPTIVTNPTNSIIGMQFSEEDSNDNKWLTLAETAELNFLANTNSTVVIVFENFSYNPSSGTDNRQILSNSSTSSDPGLAIFYNEGTGGTLTSTVAYRNAGNTITTVAGLDVVSLDGDVQILATRFDESTGMDLDVSGTSDLSSSATISNAPLDVNPNENLFVGTNADNSSLANNADFRGIIHAIYIYSTTISDSDMATFITKLKTKWGVG